MSEEIRLQGVHFRQVRGGYFLAGQGIEKVRKVDMCPEERLQIAVHVDDFFVATHVLSRASWNQLRSEPCTDEGDSDPVECSWSGASAWADRMSRTTSLRVRLITEIEWEYVASNGGTYPPYGQPVDSGAPSRWGVKGMLKGFEWCLDTYRPDGVYPDSLVWTGASTNVGELVPPADGLPMLKSMRGAGPTDQIVHPAAARCAGELTGHFARVRLALFL